MTGEESRDARVLLTTHPADGAEAFARSLVERRIAACVNLVPIRSVYRWEGRVASEAEVLLVVKTAADRLLELERALADDHPYDVPELVALAPDHVGHPYLEWLLAETRAGGADGG